MKRHKSKRRTDEVIIDNGFFTNIEEEIHYEQLNWATIKAEEEKTEADKLADIADSLFDNTLNRPRKIKVETKTKEETLIEKAVKEAKEEVSKKALELQTDSVENKETRPEPESDKIILDSEETKTKLKSVTPVKEDKDEQKNINTTEYKELKSDGTGVIIPTEINTENVFISEFSSKARKEAKESLADTYTKPVGFPYCKKGSLLTNAEQILYNFMKESLNNKIIIFSKVRLADIIDVDNRITFDKSYFHKISSKHIDFVICDKLTFDVICAVELDDYTHETPERVQRDNFVEQALKAAKLPLVRIKTRVHCLGLVDLRKIEYQINYYQAPICPICGAKTIPKEAKSGYRAGHRFFGCPNYSNNGCKYTEDID